MIVLENIKLALDSVRVNKLRTGLTLLSISIGIFAITGAGALVESINATMTEQLENLGETVFYITRTPMIQMGPGQWREYAARKHLTYAQYNELKQHAFLPTDFCVLSQDGGVVEMKYRELKTDKDIQMVSADASMMPMLNYAPEVGRAFTEVEIQSASRVIVLGNDVVQKLFGGDKEAALGKEVRLDGHKFTVIGIPKTRGAMMGQSMDKYVIVPITWAIKYYFEDGKNTDIQIAVKARSVGTIDETVSETIGILRSIRNCKPWDVNNFEVSDNASISEQFSSITKYLSFFGAACGTIALIAAGVGITNIMLVSVKERTREIGVRKAVGAKNSAIMTQFLVEAVTLCLLGAVFGIIIGLVLGSAMGTLIGITLGIPYGWIVFSIIACTVLGIVSGAYPAWKAAKLDPIDALRYE